ncbi:MAG: tetratricopeptide repeat protein [Spirochaetaceae bacterium]|nr:tetratricopeptide repeat protein [Spirochaetaceae bacterium]
MIFQKAAYLIKYFILNTADIIKSFALKTRDIITGFIFSFFHKKNNYSRFTEEIWEEDFSLPNKSRFTDSAHEKYSYEIIPQEGLLFKFKSKNLFAWCLAPDSNYSDFTAECSFEFKTDAYCSAGMIFRMGNDYNYYYFLASNKGYFRIDCVFNGKPMRLIEWTQIVSPLESVVTLRITAWDSYFLFYIDNIQVAKLNDETIGNGSITFCAQNYDTAPEAEILFKKISVNSIPDEVEKLYSDKIEIPLPQRLVLAKAFFGNGKFLPAAVQMKSYLDNINKEDITDELLGFYGEILLNLGMYEDALKYFNEALEKKPDEKNYILEKANILYQLGNYEELKVFLSNMENMFQDNPIYWNLRGHSMFYLGNNETASEFYKKATELDKENPFCFINLAKACEALGDNEKTASCYAEGSLLFFRQNNYSEAEDAASIALKKETGNKEIEVKAKSVIAKILFSEGKYFKAEGEFKNLVEADPETCGSEMFFLYALIKLSQGKTEDAIPLIEKACEKEEYYLYWYKLAEIFYLTGKDPQGPLSKAYNLAPEDIWVNNLLGEIALQKRDSENAEKYFEKSFSLGKSSHEVIPAINYSEALIINNKTEQALDILETFPNDQDKEILLQKGRIYELLEREEDLEKVYKKAFALYPKDKDAARAMASFYFNSEQYGKAEEILVGIDDLETDNTLLNITGNIARIIGNFNAAFDAYEKSLALKYDPVVALNYIEGLCEILKYKEAKIKLDEYFNSKAAGESDMFGANNAYIDNEKILNDRSGKLQKRLERLRARISNETETKLACVSCNKEWTVPNDVADSDKKLTLVGDPDPSSPAGKCPTCNKIYCVKCATEWLEEGRFKCPECKENLKLSDKNLRYLALESASDK